MKKRLLTNNEASEVAHQLWMVSQDQEKRLKALHEDGHPERATSEKVVSTSMHILAIVEKDTGALVRRDPNELGEVNCPCHRDLTHEEGLLLNESMDLHSDRIRHLFPRELTFAYLEQLARELCRVELESGNFYFGRPPSDKAPGTHSVIVIDHAVKPEPASN